MRRANEAPARGETRVILDSVRRLVRFVRTSAASSSGTLGVSAAQHFVLHALADAGVLSVNELAERTYTDQSSVSVVVRRLVEQGLVDRRRSDQDGRRVDLALTARGRALLAGAARAPTADLVDGVARMSRADRKRLAAALSGLLKAMEIDATPAPMLFEDAPRRRGRRVETRPDR